MSWGDFPLEETINHFFTTRAFATGIPTVLSATPVLSDYEDTNLTQITSGVSVTVDADGIVGLNRANVVATAANGYESGKSYTVVITTGTVGGVSVVGEVVGEFTVERGAAFIRLGAPVAASISADIAVVDLNVDQIETAVIANAAGADIAADIIALKAETVLILADTDDIGVAGAGLSAIPISDANVTQLAGVTQSLTDLKDFADAGYDPGTNKVQGVVLVDTTTTNTDLVTAAAITDAVLDEDMTAHQTTGTLGQAIGDPVSNTKTLYAALITDGAGASVTDDVAAVKTVVDGIQTDLDNGTDGLGAIKAETALILIDTGTTLDTKINDIQGATFSSATDSLEAIRDRGDAAWATAGGGTTGTSDSGSTTTMVDAARTESDTDYWKGSWIQFTSGNINGQVRLITGFVPASDTITFSPAVTQAVATQTYSLLAAADIDLVNTVSTLTGHTAQTGDSFARIGAPVAASISADIAVVDLNVDQIETAVIDNAAGADVAADIIALKAETVLIVADTNELQTDWADAGRLDAILDARMAEASINTTGGAVDTVTTVTNNGNYTTGTSDSGTTTTMVDAARTEGDTDYWAGDWIQFTSGNISGQTRLITAFTTASDTITFAPATTQAVATQGYVIIPAANIDLVNTVSTLTGHTVQTGDSFARLGAPIAASISADIAVVDANVDKVPLSDGTVTWNATALGSINAEADTALTDYGALKPTTAGRDLDVTAGGTAGIDWANVEAPTTAVDLSATDIQLCDTVTTLTGHTVQTGDNFARLGAPVAASISADIAVVDANVDKVPLSDGTVTWNATALASINAEVDTALDTTVAELSQGVPTATPTMRTGMMLMYMTLRNKLDVATVATDTLEIHNDAGTRITQKLLTDDGTDYSEAKMTSGA